MAKDLTVNYGRGNNRIRALRGVDLSLEQGGAVGIVGRSGCGKSTLARCLTGLLQGRGQVLLDGVAIADMARRGHAQLIFQSPSGALDPLWPVGRSVAEPLLHLKGYQRGQPLDDAVGGLLGQVGLKPSWAGAYPHQLSGGQLQRICIARALAAEPQLLVADEPTASLDALTQGRILRLLGQVRRARGLALVLVSHDFRLVSQLCDHVCVMCDGEIVERLATAGLSAASHPESLALLKAADAQG